jgi:hypothetical protein
MYPDRELTRLAAYKAALRRGIALRRAQCAVAAARVAQPLEWLDRMLAFWRRLSPFVKFAALPLGFLLKRSLAPRTRVLGTLLRWGPPVLGAVWSLTGARDRSDHG